MLLLSRVESTINILDLILCSVIGHSLWQMFFDHCALFVSNASETPSSRHCVQIQSGIMIFPEHYRKRRLLTSGTLPFFIFLNKQTTPTKSTTGFPVRDKYNPNHFSIPIYIQTAHRQHVTSSSSHLPHFFREWNTEGNEQGDEPI